MSLDTIAWQKPIFAEKLNRFDLLKLKIEDGEKREKLRVSRNHAFEQVASVLDRFLVFSGLQSEIIIGDYDDSL